MANSNEYKAGDIIKDIRDRLPSAATEDQLVRWINSAVSELYGDIAPEVKYTLTLTKGNGKLALPPDVLPPNIRVITVDGVRYNARGDGAASPFSWCVLEDGIIEIAPAPRGGESLTYYYRARPNKVMTYDELKAQMPSESPAYVRLTFEAQILKIFDVFAELIKLYVLVILAEMMCDIALANNFKLDYNELLRRARIEKYRYRGKYPRTVDVVKPGQWSRRQG